MREWTNNKETNGLKMKDKENKWMTLEEAEWTSKYEWKLMKERREKNEWKLMNVMNEQKLMDKNDWLNVR